MTVVNFSLIEEHETYQKFCDHNKYLKGNNSDNNNNNNHHATHCQSTNIDDAIKDNLMRKVQIPPSIYFGGAAFGCGYYIGVYKAMIEMWGTDFMDHTILSGDSAGVIFVLGISLKYSPEYIAKLYLDTGNLSPNGLLNKNGYQNLEDCCLRKLLDSDDVLKKLNNRCYIGRSSFFDQHIWENSWDSLEDLLRCCKNTLHIPLLVPSNGDINSIEGGFCCKGSDFIHGNDTMFIGDDSYADICMNMTPKQLLFPTKGKEFEQMIDIGYRTFMNWNGNMKLKVGNRKTKTIIQIILWTMKSIEIFIDIFSFLSRKLFTSYLIWFSILVLIIILLF